MRERLTGRQAQQSLPPIVGTALGVALAVWAFSQYAYPPLDTPAVSSAPPPVAAESLAAPPGAAAPGAILSAQGPTPTSEGPYAPIAEPPAAPPPRTAPSRYVVEPGDVLWQIAERFGLRSETLVWANELEAPDLLRVGQTLVIPPVDGVFYTVRPGERLADVAIRYGVELETVARSNGLSDVNQVQTGVDVFLPGARPLRRPAALAAAAVEPQVQAPSEPDGSQQTAAPGPPVPLPDNIEQLLSAGWLATDRPTPFYKAADSSRAVLETLPPGVRLERLDGFKGGLIQVRDPGDGRTRQAMTGWASALDLSVGRAPSPRELPRAYPANTAMDISHVFAPYRSQLDGSAYAAANCGPTTISMALDAFGVNVSSAQLRAEALNVQRIWGDQVGTLITALAQVVEQRGLKTYDLYARGGGTYRWTLDDIREHVAAGRLVVVQVAYRGLPGRAGAAFAGDHYILVTGLLKDSFLYNDSIDSDGVGWDRVIGPEQLRAAMNATDRRYAYAAFAVSR